MKRTLIEISRIFLVLIACVFSGCTREKSETGKNSGELNLFAWTEYVPAEVIKGFEKETGIKVRYETYDSNEQMMAKLLAGGAKYDLIQPSEYTVEYLIKNGRVQALDWLKIPNIKNIAPEFKNLGHDPEQKYSVIWMTGTVGIVINTDKVKEPVLGFKDLFQTKYAGRIIVADDSREIVSWALTAQGIDVNSVTRENLQQIKPMLGQWIKLIKIYDSTSPKDKLRAGDVDLGVVWSGEAAALCAEDKKWKYVLPTEGAHMFLDSLCVPSTATHKESAHAFMDYILRPEISKLISDKFPYTNPNTEARKLLSKEQLANPASYPPPGKLGIFRDIGSIQSELDKLVTELKGK